MSGDATVRLANFRDNLVGDLLSTKGATSNDTLFVVFEIRNHPHHLTENGVR